MRFCLRVTAPLSVESFMFERGPAKIQNTVRQLIGRLLLIEEESRYLNIDGVAAMLRSIEGKIPSLLAIRSLLTSRATASLRKIAVPGSFDTFPLPPELSKCVHQFEGGSIAWSVMTEESPPAASL